MKPTKVSGAAVAQVPLCEELIEAVCAQISDPDPDEPSLGLHAQVAAVRLGVNGRSWRRWVKIGRDLLDEAIEPHTEHEALCVLAVLRIEQAEADVEHDWNREREFALRANKRSWAGYMTNLERRFPARYRRPSVQAAVVKQESMEEELDRLTAEAG